MKNKKIKYTRKKINSLIKVIRQNTTITQDCVFLVFNKFVTRKHNLVSFADKQKKNKQKSPNNT